MLGLAEMHLVNEEVHTYVPAVNMNMPIRMMITFNENPQSPLIPRRWIQPGP